MFKKILYMLACLFYVVNACPEKKEELKKAFSAINEHFTGVVQPLRHILVVGMGMETKDGKTGHVREDSGKKKN